MSARFGLVSIAFAHGCVVGVPEGPGELGTPPGLAPSSATASVGSSSGDTTSSGDGSSSDAGSSGTPIRDDAARLDLGGGETTGTSPDLPAATCGTACTSEPVCGDGVIEGDEECESPLTQSCSDLDPDLGGGQVRCTNDCRYDVDDCRCRGLGQHCNGGWNDESNCCPAGFKGNVTGLCDEQSEQCG